MKTMKLKELVGLLRTFEIYLEDEKCTTSSHCNLALNTNYDVSRMDMNRGINCRECGGYDHVQEECFNILSYAATWSDKDSENNKDGEDILIESVELVSLKFLAMFQLLVHKIVYQVVKHMTMFLHLVN